MTESHSLNQDEDDKPLARGALDTSPNSAAGRQPPAGHNSLSLDEFDKLLSSAPALQGSSPPADLQIPSSRRMTGGVSSRMPDSAIQGSAAAGPIQQNVETLLRRAEQALASITSCNPRAPVQGIAPLKLPEFDGPNASGEAAFPDSAPDAEIKVRIELGRTRMHLEELLEVRQGSVLTLDALTEDPADVVVDGRLVARGEVLVLNDKLCVRVTELLADENSDE